MTSTIALMVLGLSIPMMIGVFFFLPPLPACLVVALGGEMLLPIECVFRIPWVPPLGKHNLPYLCIWIGCLLRCPARVTKLPKEKWFICCSALALVGGAMTGLTNPEVMTFGPHGEVVVPAMTFKDGMFVGINEFFPSSMAFYLGYTLFRGAKDIEKLLAGLGIAGLLYCPFAIVEMRMSPQFHYWVYGYSGGTLQAVRWGGYRPVVFMVHGLALARYFMVSTLSLLVLAKSRRLLLGLPVRLLAWFNAVILVLCRSTGAVILGFVGIVFILFAKPKRQLQLAVFLAIAVLAYPWLRASGLFPIGDILNAAGEVSADRQESLAFRFINEDHLLSRASEKILFGWGTYGRSFIRDATGEVTSVTDGYWIIILGVSGIVGIIITFGVLLWPVGIVRRHLRKHLNKGNVDSLVGLTLILTLIAVDLIPNSIYSFYPFLMAGAITRGVRNWKSMRDLIGAESSTKPTPPLHIDPTTVGL